MFNQNYFFFFASRASRVLWPLCLFCYVLVLLLSTAYIYKLVWSICNNPSNPLGNYLPNFGLFSHTHALINILLNTQKKSSIGLQAFLNVYFSTLQTLAAFSVSNLSISSQKTLVSLLALSLPFWSIPSKFSQDSKIWQDRVNLFFTFALFLKDHSALLLSVQYL